MTKNSILKKRILFIALGLSIVTSSFAQNCPIIDSDSINITNICDITAITSNDGEIDLVLLNPLGNYSFLWSDANGVTIGMSPAVTTTVTSLAEGTYTVRVTDNSPLNPGCFQLDTFTITKPQDPLSSAVNLYQNVLCYGDSTGIAIANVIGGTDPYTYLWDNGQTTQIANTLSAGIHTIIFTDVNGCTLLDDILIENEHDLIVGTINIVQNVSCFGACDGIVELSSTGGVTPYDYDWDTGQQYHGSGPNTETALCYGGHDIIITDALGCREIVTFVITQPDELFTQAVQSQPVQCYGFDDGISSASATGGTTPYSFGWIDINGDTVVGETGQIIDSLTPGIHTIYISDAKGCTASDSVVITEPTQLEVVIIPDSTIYSYCVGTNSGQLCALASGGTPNYIYLWNDVLHQNTPCATDLNAQYNDYAIIVMDDRDCIATASFQLDSITNSMNENSVDFNINSVSCFGKYDGDILINSVVGGVGSYTYSWTGPGNPGYTNTGDFINLLYAGSYAVIIKDDNDCSITANVEVGQPDQLEYTTYNVINETCYGSCDGKISVNVQGGTGNYYYDVSETGAFPISASNQVQLINDSLIVNLCSDMYSIYVTDDNNCEGAVAWGGSWQEQVGPGVVVSVSGVTSHPASCFNINDGNSLIQSPNPLFTYTWETLAGTVIDIGVETSLLYSGSDYNVVAHYADSASFGQIYSSCDYTAPFTTPFVTHLLSGEAVTDVSCFGLNDGKILLNPTSLAPGTPTVLWDTTTSIPGSSTEDTLSPLQPGTYTVTITDAYGCSITNDIIVDEPGAITSSISVIEPLCYNDDNGKVTITIQGGVPLMTYAYIDLSGDTIGNPDNIIDNLGSGVYTIIVTDNNGCLENFWVDVTQPEQIISSLEPNLFYNENDLGIPYHISCFGSSDGSAVVSNGGGVPPITYAWSSSSGIAVEETGIPAGDVTVTVTDANNCSESQTITLIEPAYLDPNIQDSIYSTSTNGITNEISCYGFSDGWLESQTLGGVETPNETYQYKWVNDITGEIVSFQAISDYLSANTSYTVTVTDANGCVSNSTSSVLDEPLEFLADVTTINYGGPTHAPFTTTFLDNTISNDKFNFNWNWEDGTSSYPDGTLTFDHLFIRENIGENNVYVIVTNLATSCFDSIPFIINVQGVPDINNVFTPNGDPYNNEFHFGEHSMLNIDVQIFNRWGQLVYSWIGENKAWDGKGADGQDLPEAVYFYVVKAEGTDGHYYDKKGSVTLLR